MTPPRALGIRLSAMMFLQYAIWGAWLPLLWPYLANHRGFSGEQIGHMFMVGAVGALVAPWVAGQIADRHFATEKFLAISHVAGGLLVWQLARLEGYWWFLGFSLIYSLIYAPTLALTNSISFAHLPDRDRDFGRVRVWGTVGWIVVGIAIGQWLLHHHTPADASPEAQRAAQYAGMADAFRLSAILGIGLGVYCLTLPRTPPSDGVKSNATVEALGEIRRNPLLTLFLLAVPISCIHQFYFVHTAEFLGGFQSRTATLINDVFGVGGGGLMTVGQMSEIAVLAGIPLIAKRVSRKSLLSVGVAAYAARMALFAYADPVSAWTGLPAVAVVVAGVALHGLCFGCFIFVAFMVVDEQTTGDVRASAQSFFNLVIVGVGIIAGSYIATSIVPRWATTDGVLSYTRLFAVPMWASVATLVLMAVFYPGGRVAVVEPIEATERRSDEATKE